MHSQALPNNHALLIAGGEVDLQDVQYVHKPLLVMVTDGSGLRNALSLGLQPHMVVGDGDSGSTMIHVAQYVHKSSQNISDFAFALQLLIQRGFQYIVVLGITGKRTDHMFSNFGVCSQYAHKVCLQGISPDSEFFWITSHRVCTDTIYARSFQLGQTVSFLPQPSAWGVTLTGFQYPLTKAHMYYDGLISLSNVITDVRYAITLEEGCICMIIPRHL